MKKIFIISAVIIAVLLMFSSCGNKMVDETGKRIIVLDTIQNISDYVVIRGENASEGEIKLAGDIRSTVSAAIDSQLSIKTDWNTPQKFEILVGNTSRKESKEALDGLRYYEYVIKLVNNKIVIAAGSEETLSTACQFFKDNFIVDNIVKAPAYDGFVQKGDYIVNSIKINGKDISDFSVYYSGTILNTENGALHDFMSELRKGLGIGDIERENMNKDKSYIVINNTGFIADEYSVEVRDGNIYLNGSYNTIGNAMEYFVKDILGGKKDISLDNGYKSDVMSVGKKEIYSKEKLYDVLETVYNNHDQCIIGEETDLRLAMPSDTIANFVAGTGEEPGIIGLDLGIYGLFLLQSMETQSEKISQAICEIVDYTSRGGILTISSHWSNPTDLGMYVKGHIGSFESNEEFEDAYRQLYTEGSELNTVLMNQVKIDGDFLEALKNNGVPVIFRPLHEMNGNWFWFCTSSEGHRIKAETFVDFWRYIYNYYSNVRGLDNLLWCYSPNTSGTNPTDPGGTLYYYPGDEYCDMVGVDWYTHGSLEIRNSNNYLDLAEKSGKIGALTEFGPDGGVKAPSKEEQPQYYSTERLMNDLMKLKEEGYSFTYLLTWTAQATIGAMGGSYGGFEFMQDDFSLGLSEVAKLFGK